MWLNCGLEKSCEKLRNDKYVKKNYPVENLFGILGCNKDYINLGGRGCLNGYNMHCISKSKRANIKMGGEWA